MATQPANLDNDIEARLLQQIQQAVATKQPLAIVGGQSKRFYGRADGQTLTPLDVSSHCGISNYQPGELVITARAGTSIAELNSVLTEHGQMMPFEPPVFGGKATLGGTLACGFSGPARPYTGAARDYVLGTRIINGKAEVLQTGGEVIKNVAGYDVSRLMVGAMGTLGVILQASMKVLPLPPTRATLRFQLRRDQAIEWLNKLAGKSLPITGSCFYHDELLIRVAGSDASINSAHRYLGGEMLPSADAVWRSLREFQHPFFQANNANNNETALWRIALPAMAIPDLAGECLIEWGGMQWWLRSAAAPEDIRLTVAKAGGHATLFRGGNRGGDVFHPLSPGMQKLQERIRHCFDPERLFNPGRINTTNAIPSSNAN